MAANQHHQRYLANLLTSFSEWQEISPSTQQRLMNILDREIIKDSSEPVITRFANEVTLSLYSAERMVIEKIIRKLQLTKLIFEQIKQIISERMIQERVIHLNTKIEKDLGLDESDLIWLILRCEQIFHIQIDESDVIRPLLTLRSYVAYVSQLYFKEMDFNSPTRFMNAS